MKCKHISHCHCFCCCCCSCSACDDLLTNLRLVKTRELFAACLNESHADAAPMLLSSKLFYLSIGLHDKCERVLVLYL